MGKFGHFSSKKWWGRGVENVAKYSGNDVITDSV